MTESQEIKVIQVNHFENCVNSSASSNSATINISFTYDSLQSKLHFNHAKKVFNYIS